MVRRIEIKLSTIFKAMEEAQEKKCDTVVLNCILGKFTIEEDPQAIDVCITDINPDKLSPEMEEHLIKFHVNDANAVLDNVIKRLVVLEGKVGQ